MRKDEFPIVDKLVKDSINDVLDKIRTEIEQVAEEESKIDKKWGQGLKYAVKIIDKYRKEQE